MRAVPLLCIIHLLECTARAAAVEASSAANVGRTMCSKGEAAEETEYACMLPTANLTLYVGDNYDYVKIECDEDLGGELVCADLPLLPELRDKALRSIDIAYCHLPEDKIVCLVRALGARSVRHLFLSNTPGGAAVALRTEQLVDLNVVALTIREAQTSDAILPLQALTALPTLRAFRVHGTGLSVPSSAFITSPNLTLLELIECNITTLLRGTFDGLSSLRRLILRSDGISQIHSGAFNGLLALEELDLAMNELHSLPSGLFTGTTSSLRLLVLSGNPLEYMPGGGLSGLGQLKLVDLFDGHSPLRLGSRALADLPSLEEVQLSRCKMEMLPSDTLRGSRAISLLNLSINRLRYLPPDLLRDQSDLRNLDLSANQIETIERQLFASLGHLQRLDLRKNLIEVLPPEVFSGLSSMTWLSLSDNRLKHIASDAFPRGAPLEHLLLARNALPLRAEYHLPSVSSALNASADTSDTVDYFAEDLSPLARLVALRVLDLSHNHIETMFYDWRVHFTFLETLNLTYNNITLLTDSEINFLQENIIVDLRHNDITKIMLTDVSWESRSAPVKSRILFDSTALNCDCALFDALKRLHGGPVPPSEPRLEADPAAACAAPPELAARPLLTLQPAELACTMPCPQPCTTCRLRPAVPAPFEIICDAPPDASVLDDYYERHYNMLNQSMHVSLTLRRPLAAFDAISPRILSLDLAGLDLKDVPTGPPPPELLKINLSNNNLTAIPLDLIPKGTPLKIRIAQNPFSCDCVHSSDVEELQRRNEKILDYEEVMCSDGEPAWRVDAGRLCSARVAAGAAGALALLGLVVAAVALLAFRARAKIRVWLLSRGFCTSCFGDGDEPYDAFVAFAYEDRRFVMDTLVKQLENPPFRYRLCVQYRDWGAGDWVPAEIERSVNISRRTIVVVSTHFLETPWSLLEFRAAQTRALSEGRARVVAVLLEDLGADARLAGDLRAYLRSHAPLRWGEPHFWWRMQRALGRRRSRPPRVASSLDVATDAGGLRVCLTEDGKLLPMKNDKF